MRKRLQLAGLAVMAMIVGLAAGAAQPPAGKANYARYYMISIRETPEAFALRTDLSRGEAYWKPWTAYMESLQTAGVLRFGLPMHLDDKSKQVKMTDGKAVVTDGKSAAGQAQLSGFFVIEVDSLDEALAWAAKVPNANEHAVEVRSGFGPPPAK